jgi:hypothetical protein
VTIFYYFFHTHTHKKCCCCSFPIFIFSPLRIVRFLFCSYTFIMPRIFHALHRGMS